MQGQVEEKTMAIVMDLGRTGGRLTAQALARALALTGRAIQRNTIGRDFGGNVTAQGKMSVKNMMRKNGALGVSDVEVMKEDLSLFERCARKNGVEYAIHRQADTPDKVTIFLRANNKDTMMDLMKEYATTVLKKENRARPSVRNRLHKAQEQVKEQLRQRAKERARQSVREASREAPWEGPLR